MAQLTNRDAVLVALLLKYSILFKYYLNSSRLVNPLFQIVCVNFTIEILFSNKSDLFTI
jgi:hypothetical protein